MRSRLQGMTKQWLPDASARSRSVVRGDEVSKRGRDLRRQLVRILKRPQGLFVTQQFLELLELLNRLENFIGLIRFGEQTVLFLGRTPRSTRIDQKREDRLARLLCRVHFEPGDGSLTVSTQFRRRDVAVAMGHEADHRIGLGGLLHAFARRDARLRRERLHGDRQVLKAKNGVPNLIAILDKITGGRRDEDAQDRVRHFS
jgi:hypothetical protein